MKKVSIEKFINKYNLGGEVESVMIKSNDKQLAVKFVSDDKTLLGSVLLKESDFPDGEFGIYTTSQLKGLLGVLESNVDITATPQSLELKDTRTSVNYMLAKADVIPVVPELKQLPPFGIEIKLDDEFTSKFIKSKGALSESETFTFMYENGVGKIVLGYSSINTNRVSLTVECTCEGDVKPISFSAKYLKGILEANRSSNSSVLKISTAGLVKMNFETDTLVSEYYLTEIK